MLVWNQLKQEAWGRKGQSGTLGSVGEPCLCQGQETERRGRAAGEWLELHGECMGAMFN